MKAKIIDLLIGAVLFTIIWIVFGEIFTAGASAEMTFCIKKG